jgi:hypothetical protein
VIITPAVTAFKGRKKISSGEGTDVVRVFHNDCSILVIVEISLGDQPLQMPTTWSLP